MKIENGFIIGRHWESKKTVMIGVHAVLRVVLDNGNSPSADRVYFMDGNIPHVDLLRD